MKKCSVFKFSPLQYVLITAHGLNLNGRIVRCIYEGNGTPLIYDVAYATNGETRRQEFYEDELQECN